MELIIPAAHAVAINAEHSFRRGSVPTSHLARFHASSNRRFTPALCSLSEVSSKGSTARDDLLDLVSDQERGLKTQKDSKKREKIIKAIDSLTVLGKDMITTSDQSLSGTWRMLWTTEKEQLFIIEKAPVFGTEAGDILQVIDVKAEKLNNVITFPPDGAFIVDSIIEVASPQRVNFRFTGASLRGSGWNIPVPPFGQGWFDSVYIDERIRVAKDIRGDYLVVDRAPYKWNG
ncbi:hypothetical protein KP509_15G064500 [Ceratopteris richardii]|uniref:Plastid lipid-associated protein/fibrillin conserved domain-containing protein n=1 Tax=Ceratopteris richardii TaxID=49495 RepID=A0A8T2T479_CERRI|nr:hypothetical protein KP509_15G064500 [Ceratopteris richardii]KAH7405296.1 hypothetical protein KP509_15G064500 [Ceratopteris richardii]